MRLHLPWGGHWPSIIFCINNLDPKCLILARYSLRVWFFHFPTFFTPRDDARVSVHCELIPASYARIRAPCFSYALSCISFTTGSVPVPFFCFLQNQQSELQFLSRQQGLGRLELVAIIVPNAYGVCSTTCWCSDSCNVTLLCTPVLHKPAPSRHPEMICPSSPLQDPQREIMMCAELQGESSPPGLDVIRAMQGRG